MKKMLKTVLALLLLGGCAGSWNAGKEIQLPDGRSVMCVFDSGGGVSCDWENAK